MFDDLKVCDKMQKNICLFLLASICGIFLTVKAQTDLDAPECVSYVDLMIVVDGSYSVTASNFEYVKTWMKDVARGFDIDKGYVQIGVVQYSYWYPRRPMWRQKYLKTEINLGEYGDQVSFNAAVDNIKYQGYRTFTAHAINKTVDYDFQSRLSRYPDAQRAIILLTDGKATDSIDLPGAVRHAEEDAGVVIFAVGVGDYSLEELLIITNGKRERVFELHNFEELADIVYELPLTLGKACDCDVLGSIGSDCDACTRQCTCKPNVTGRRCDRCAPGFFNITNAEGCQACHCDPRGTVGGNECFQDTGICKCRYYGVTGPMCDRCLEGMYGFPRCARCQCNGYSRTCSSQFGICLNCSDNRGGIRCEMCKSGFFLNQDNECEACDCNGHVNASDPLACDVRTGQCLKCLDGTAGKHCELCDEYHFKNNTTENCEKCECSNLGTDPDRCREGNCLCNSITRQCFCLQNVVGTNCDVCADGFFGITPGSGCSPCNCHGKGSTDQICDKETGQCTCLSGFKGVKCESCDSGHTMTDEGDGCSACDCNLNGSMNGTCVEGVCACDPVTGQCPCLPNVRGLSCDNCIPGHWNFGQLSGCLDCQCNDVGSVSLSCEQNTGQCECLPGYYGIRCEQCAQGYFGENPKLGCKACQCNISGTRNCTEEVCSCDSVTGDCSCLPNIIGSLCDTCKDGYWQFGSPSGCRSCQCDDDGSVSAICDKVSGECECLSGYVGRDCDQCKDGYFGKKSSIGCTVCNCNLHGVVPEECNDENCTCDSTSGQCPCLPMVRGTSCDRCIDKFWGFNTPEGCRSCECSGVGSANQICYENTGQCDCLPGYSGQKCDQCSDNHFGDPNIECLSCECNFTGSDSNLCDSDICNCNPVTGQCPCLPSIVGRNCDKCEIGYWGFGSKTGCQKCACNSYGSLSTICQENTGQCECLPGYTGLKCDQCEEHHYGHPELGCRECSCVLEGTNQDTCLDQSCACESPAGQCDCLPHVEGLSCNQCKDRFWNFGAGGCTSCDCHGLGSRSPVCDKISGQCDCLPGYYGLKCEKCARGHYGTNKNDGCRACSCNLSGSVEAICTDGVCACDPISGQCPCLPNVVGLSCNRCVDRYWGFGSEKGCRACQCATYGSLSQSCTQDTGKCECLPQYSGTKCDRCNDGYYSEDPEMQCAKCKCDLKGTNSSQCDVDECICDRVTGQCPCLPNVVGLSCDKCNDGFWNLGAPNGCESCSCNSVGCSSSLCNKNTGKCDCYSGHVGPKCEKCDNGYFRSNKSQRCQKCVCNRLGRNQTACEGDVCSCNEITGQCSCLPNVLGIACDRCEDGFWKLGSMRGCISCGCHQNGSENELCDEKTGQCDCLKGHSGRRCDECKKGFFKEKYENRCKPDSLNDQPDNFTETASTNKTEPTQSHKTTTTTSTPTVIRTTRRPIRPTWKPMTRMPIYPAKTTRSPPKHSGCNRCISWPSFCRGWICRRRWPHYNFTPAPWRCNYGHTVCQYNAEATHGSSRFRGRKITGGYYAAKKYNRVRVSTTVAPTRRTTSRPKFGYRAYASNYQNYYVPYYSSRQTHAQYRLPVRSSKKPVSYGLYNSLRGRKK